MTLLLIIILVLLLPIVRLTLVAAVTLVVLIVPTYVLSLVLGRVLAALLHFPMCILFLKLLHLFTMIIILLLLATILIIVTVLRRFVLQLALEILVKLSVLFIYLLQCMGLVRFPELFVKVVVFRLHHAEVLDVGDAAIALIADRVLCFLVRLAYDAGTLVASEVLEHGATLVEEATVGLVIVVLILILAIRIIPVRITVLSLDLVVIFVLFGIIEGHNILAVLPRPQPLQILLFTLLELQLAGHDPVPKLHVWTTFVLELLCKIEFFGFVGMRPPIRVLFNLLDVASHHVSVGRHDDYWKRDIGLGSQVLVNLCVLDEDLDLVLDFEQLAQDRSADAIRQWDLLRGKLELLLLLFVTNSVRYLITELSLLALLLLAFSLEQLLVHHFLPRLQDLLLHHIEDVNASYESKEIGFDRCLAPAIVKVAANRQ